MKDDFYLAFENRFRGPEDEIRSRLEFYLRYILPIRDHYNEARALDIGCGRGEWLQILKVNDFIEFGVDLNAAMVQECLARGLNAKKENALEVLEQIEDNSLAVITAFHLVEHLPFDITRQIIRNSLRCLKPGGVFIAETPNPENLLVGSCNFYMDPTHRNPIPPQLLAFTAEYEGFSRVKIDRLQESMLLHQKTDVTILDVLCGTSPDYSIICQKEAPPGLNEIIAEEFSKDYGLTLDALASRFEGRIAVGLDKPKDKENRLTRISSVLIAGMRRIKRMTQSKEI